MTSSDRLTSSDSRDGALARLADAMFMHRKKVILGWVVISAVAIAGGLSLAGTYTVD
jgi:putative drug exporter of the RND superfamily